MSHDNTKEESFLYASNYGYLKTLLEKKYAKMMEEGGDELFDLLEPGISESDFVDFRKEMKSRRGSIPSAAAQEGVLQKNVFCLIEAYRKNGCRAADLDPLKVSQQEKLDVLDLASHGISESDFDKVVSLGGELGLESATVREVIEKLQSCYCGQYSAEYSHIQESQELNWLKQKFESLSVEVPQATKKKILNDLLEVETFEQFLHLKFAGAKRFSCEGGESSLIAFESLIDAFSAQGVEEVVVGMPHRGRLSFIVKSIGIPYGRVVNEFAGNPASFDNFDISGDVKYHMGASASRMTSHGKSLYVTLTPNPSHLEAVNTVVLGRVRAKQDIKNADTTKVVGVLFHGDASFSGQGSVYEYLTMSRLKGYDVGGMLHIVVNNQIGFTAEKEQYCSSVFPSDVVKFLGIPVFHVNGDNPEAVYAVSTLAAEYRKTFKKDALIHVLCYRKYGHNETDEPAFTQPLMYQKIVNHQTVSRLYSEFLLRSQALEEQELGAMKESAKVALSDSLKTEERLIKLDWLEKHWEAIQPCDKTLDLPLTGVSQKFVERAIQALSSFPEGFSVNPKLLKIVEQRKAMLRGEAPLDWGTAEFLAFSSMLLDGYSVRVSGQDSIRGTFAHRHAGFFDGIKGELFFPLQTLEQEDVKFQVISSPLSEYGVLGFEYGYSSVNPNVFVVWEAQYGDFANGAQIVIDQFISSAEAKWMRMSGLTLLLPHGYEGQRPEHSSARLERYLQLCAENNMRVVNCTTPANYFHVLRRQIASKTRKPLIVMTPKSTLRKKESFSAINDFRDQACFEMIKADPYIKDRSTVSRVVLCSGKVYYDLLARLQKEKTHGVAIVRMEQLYPFPEEMLLDVLQKYKKIKTVVWCQEEPANMGAWSYLFPKLFGSLSNLVADIRYAGREESAATATGFSAIHVKQQEAIVERALFS